MTKDEIAEALTKVKDAKVRVIVLNEVIQEATRLAKADGVSADYTRAMIDISKFALGKMTL